MKKTDTIRVVKTENYSTIHNAGPRDTRLSWGARGILTYLLTKPDGWNPTIEDLIAQGPQKEHAVNGMLNELKKFGYLKRERIRAANGTFEWHTTLYEVPQEAVTQPEKQAQPSPENQGVVTIPRLSTPGLSIPGSSIHGKSGYIRSTEERSTDKEVLIKEEEEETRAIEPQNNSSSSSKQSTQKIFDNPLAIALMEVCDKDETELRATPKRLDELRASMAFVRAQGFTDNQAAAAEVRRRYSKANWQLPSDPHLSQIATTWAKMGRRLERQNQPQSEVTNGTASNSHGGRTAPPKPRSTIQSRFELLAELQASQRR